MNVIIVGHGPSLLSRLQGNRIDSFDTVIRQKRCQDTFRYPEIYGTRKDVVCGSFTIAPQLRDVGADEIWVFMDSRHEGVKSEVVERYETELPCRIDRELCDDWNRRYRARRTRYDKLDQRVKEFEPTGHPHLSAGFHTLIYACEFLRPQSVTLAGFDNVETGTFTWSITRGPDWQQYPDHRWDIEHKMIQDVQREWDVEVKFL